MEKLSQVKKHILERINLPWNLSVASYFIITRGNLVGANVLLI
jgi:hypothetical protein